MVKKLELPPAALKFILHWGEMGARWGINRSVAQVHALLYVSERPLHADEIVATLGLARSNVSTAVHELQSWGLVRIVHLPKDRRDHFATPSDAWEMCKAILTERKRRELDPAIGLIKDCLAESKAKSGQGALAEERLRELLDLWETSAAFYENVSNMPKDTLLKAMKLGQQLAALLDGILRHTKRAKPEEPNKA
jgi:DNA-binding transcriptional regulator GbsR (MarR family)